MGSGFNVKILKFRFNSAGFEVTVGFRIQDPGLKKLEFGLRFRV
jgi:hypothetical protein